MVEHKAGNVRVLSAACELCANPPPLGRPTTDRTVPFDNTGLSATAHVAEAQAVMETDGSAGAWAGPATDPAHHPHSGFSDLAVGGPMFGGTMMETEGSAGAWVGELGAATDPAHHPHSGFSDLAAVVFGATMMETEGSTGAWVGAATDPSHHPFSGFSDLAVGCPEDPFFEAIPSVSDFFCVPSPQELLDGKGISDSEA